MLTKLSLCRTRTNEYVALIPDKKIQPFDNYIISTFSETIYSKTSLHEAILKRERAVGARRVKRQTLPHLRPAQLSLRNPSDSRDLFFSRSPPRMRVHVDDGGACAVAASRQTARRCRVHLAAAVGSRLLNQAH